MRSFDERSQSSLGYLLCIEGTIKDEPGEFRIAVGKAAQAKHRFRADREFVGMSVTFLDPRLGTAGFYKLGGLKILQDYKDELPAGPPFRGLPPELKTSRS
jgi:hypothetical protein